MQFDPSSQDGTLLSKITFGKSHAKYISKVKNCLGETLAFIPADGLSLGGSIPIIYRIDE